jgi:hypothetical protein
MRARREADRAAMDCRPALSPISDHAAFLSMTMCPDSLSLIPCVARTLTKQRPSRSPLHPRRPRALFVVPLLLASHTAPNAVKPSEITTSSNCMSPALSPTRDPPRAASSARRCRRTEADAKSFFYRHELCIADRLQPFPGPIDPTTSTAQSRSTSSTVQASIFATPPVPPRRSPPAGCPPRWRLETTLSVSPSSPFHLKQAPYLAGFPSPPCFPATSR